MQLIQLSPHGLTAIPGAYGMRGTLGNNLRIGHVPHGTRPFDLPVSPCGVCFDFRGAAVTDKSRVLAHLIRQDLSTCPMHQCGNSSSSLTGRCMTIWLSWLTLHVSDLPIVTIDLRRDGCVVSLNWLRRRDRIPWSGILDDIMDAAAPVWRLTDIYGKPTPARGIGTVVFPYVGTRTIMLFAQYASPSDQTVQPFLWRIT